MEKLQGTIYYVNAARGDNRHTGLDHGWVTKNGSTFRDMHPLRTIQKAMDKIDAKTSAKS